MLKFADKLGIKTIKIFDSLKNIEKFDKIQASLFFCTYVYLEVPADIKVLRTIVRLNGLDSETYYISNTD